MLEVNRIQSLYNIGISISRTQSQTAQHIKKQENIILLKSQSIETNPELTQILEISTQDFKRARSNNEKIDLNRETDSNSADGLNSRLKMQKS